MNFALGCTLGAPKRSRLGARAPWRNARVHLGEKLEVETCFSQKFDVKFEENAKN